MHQVIAISEPLRKKQKLQYLAVVDEASDSHPFKYHHIRNGMCNVWNEYYMLIEKFISIYHMSYEQVEVAVRKRESKVSF